MFDPKLGRSDHRLGFDPRVQARDALQDSMSVFPTWLVPLDLISYLLQVVQVSKNNKINCERGKAKTHNPLPGYSMLSHFLQNFTPS